MSLNAQTLGLKIRELLILECSPVAVHLLSPSAERKEFQGYEELAAHRYCQALMKARHGKHVILDAEGINCPAAAAAFGFRPLPDVLASGQGMVGFGIVKEAERGRQMFESMTRMAPGSVGAIALSPLETAPQLPDVVVVEAPVEQLMWLLLAYFNTTGQRLEASTAILQATCVDCTVIPHVTAKPNFSFGCYGCREATDIGMGEALLGLPGACLAEIVDNLEYLAQKAIPRSRAKKVYETLMQGEDQRACHEQHA